MVNVRLSPSEFSIPESRLLLALWTAVYSMPKTVPGAEWVFSKDVLKEWMHLKWNTTDECIKILILFLDQKYWQVPMIYFQILRAFKCVKIRYYNGLNLWNLFINGIDLVIDLASVLASRKALMWKYMYPLPGSWPFTKLTFQMPCSKLDWFATYEVKLCHECATLFRFACLWCTKEVLHTMKDFI